MCCMFVYLTTVMDSSSEFHHLAFPPGVTIEGQFLASLAPSREPTCECQARPSAAGGGGKGLAVGKSSFSTQRATDSSKFGAVWDGGSEGSQRFWHVRLHNDDVHTIDYAMATIEDALRQEVLGADSLVRRAKVQWVTYQAHHFGVGVVAVLPEQRARRVLLALENAGLTCSIVAE
jgi:ATP-dependent Clp protease adapter protein ClpS